MNGAQQAGTTTNTSAPYAPYQPYIGTALGQGANLLQSGGQSYYPGQTVASFNNIQNQAFKNTNNLDNTLAQGSGNPYENQVFQQEMQQSQPQLASEFAGSGRDISGSEPLRAQQYSNAGAQFYGQQYQNDVNNSFNATNQQQALGGQIQGQSQAEINASKQAYDFNQNRPYQALGQFSSLLSSLMPGSGQQSSPYFTNPSANALGTALGAQQLYNGMGSGSSGSPKPSQGGVSGSPFADGQAGG